MAALVRHDDCATSRRVAVEFEPCANAGEIVRLYDALGRVDELANPRTARLLAAGRAKMAQKLLEEAGEVAIEAVRGRRRAAIHESADLIYHLIVLWHDCEIAPEAVWTEMRRRADAFGIAEKLPKVPPLATPATGGIERGGRR
jgi:phosphoribosyl-ATP pyrophosphohydrolase